MPVIENYQLYASNGRPIRKATKVILDDDTVFRFIEKLGKKEALEQVALIQDREIKEANQNDD